MNIQHSSRTDLWYTPVHVLELARTVLGTIDFDPASDQFGNTRVQAKHFLTEVEDGLTHPWHVGGTVWINPPGGKAGNKSKTALFWQRLMTYRPLISDAIFMAFSAEALQTTQRLPCEPMLAFPICIPRGRIAFDSREGASSSPSHSNAIIYVPGKLDRTDVFKDVFAQLGVCR